MAQNDTALPQDPGPGPRGLYDARRLAARLGVTVTTLRNARLRGASWLPVPAGELNRGPVWTEESLEGIEERVTPPGRPRSR